MGHDLLDPDEVGIGVDEREDNERPADMEAIDRRGMGVIQFFLIPSGKRILFQLQDPVHDDAPGFFGQFFSDLN